MPSVGQQFWRASAMTESKVIEIHNEHCLTSSTLSWHACSPDRGGAGTWMLRDVTLTEWDA